MLDNARAALVDQLGPATVVAAAAVAANFTKNDRIANGLGIPLDPMIMKVAEGLRADLGLDGFR